MIENLSPIAYMENDFPTKFGVPRQSGLVSAIKGRIVFTPPYRSMDAVRGLEGFSHIWIIWYTSEHGKNERNLTVRPPRLGGNVRLGVFATRSPFRPSGIGLSSVRLERIEEHPTLGPVLHVSGADLCSGTPILDIKPYLPLSDCHTDAVAGFAEHTAEDPLTVSFACPYPPSMTDEQREALSAILAMDPRPSYHNDPRRVYGFSYGEWEIRFTVEETKLTVRSIDPTPLS